MQLNVQFASLELFGCFCNFSLSCFFLYISCTRSKKFLLVHINECTMKRLATKSVLFSLRLYSLAQISYQSHVHIAILLCYTLCLFSFFPFLLNIGIFVLTAYFISLSVTPSNLSVSNGTVFSSFHFC